MIFKKEKNWRIFFVSLLILSYFLFCLIPITLAATPIESTVKIYKLNVPIGEWTHIAIGGKDPNPFGFYFQLWYNFILGTIGILATVMIIIGGFQWLVSRGNASQVKEGQDRIFSALIGLALAFLAYTILYLINPQLTSLNFHSNLLTAITYTQSAEERAKLESHSDTQGRTTGAPSGSAEGNAQRENSENEARIRQQLQNASVTIMSSDGTGNPCPPGTDGILGNCTNVAGLNEATVNAIIQMKNNCEQNYPGGNQAQCVELTGGSELGHHNNYNNDGSYAGNQFDIQRNGTQMDAYFQNGWNDVGNGHYQQTFSGTTYDCWQEDASHYHCEEV